MVKIWTNHSKQNTLTQLTEKIEADKALSAMSVLYYFLCPFRSSLTVSKVFYNQSLIIKETEVPDRFKLLLLFINNRYLLLSSGNDHHPSRAVNFQAMEA
jgi:hypothetical protein